MAHKKGQGSSRNGRDSNPQYRGIKRYGGEHVISGNILVRQVGSHFTPGTNVRMGRDYTIYAVAEGFVQFRPNGSVHVLPTPAPAATTPAAGAAS